MAADIAVLLAGHHQTVKIGAQAVTSRKRGVMAIEVSKRFLLANDPLACPRKKGVSFEEKRASDNWRQESFYL